MGNDVNQTEEGSWLLGFLQMRNAQARGLVDSLAQRLTAPALRPHGAVFHCAVRLAICRRFATVQDPREITRYVSAALARMDQEVWGERARKAEAVIRAEVGYGVSLIEGINRRESVVIRLGLLYDLVNHEQVADAKELIVEAEFRAPSLYRSLLRGGLTRRRRLRRLLRGEQ
jgi:hypothetical protein